MLARPELPPFDYVRARSPDEVVRLLHTHGKAARLMMGGTDLLVRMRDGRIRPEVVVDVKGIAGMRDIRYDPQVGLTIGAAVTMNQLAGDPQVRAHYPILADAAASVASYQVRNRATVGGNLCNASPAADTAPPVMTLEGRIVLHGPHGAREAPATAFFLGPGQTSVQPGEFVTGIRLPPPPAGSVGRYFKLGRSKGGDLALVSVAAFAFPDPRAAAGCRFRLALGSVAPIPLRATDAEELLAAQPPGEATFALAAGKAMEAASPIDDVRASAAYRRAMVRALTLRALREVWNDLHLCHPA